MCRHTPSAQRLVVSLRCELFQGCLTQDAASSLCDLISSDRNYLSTRARAQTHTRTHIHPSPLSPTVVCFTCFHILCTCTSRSSTAACGSTSGCCQACRCGSTLAQISTTGVTLVPRLHAAEPVKLSYSRPHCADLLSVSQCLVHPLIPNLPVEILFPNKSSGIQICKLV